jgi:cell wall assembly regulator SMI1
VDASLVERSWARIIGWCQTYAPEALTKLGPPLAEADRREVERAIGQALPDDYGAWLGLCSTSGYHGVLDHEIPLPEKALGTWRMLNGLFPPGSEAHAAVDPRRVADGVQPVWWCRGWYPYSDYGNCDHLCLDLEPTAQGIFGQVIAFRHDHETREVIAPSFAAWLADQAEGLETGGIVAVDYDDGQRDFAGLLQRASLEGSLATLWVRGESRGRRKTRLAHSYESDPVAAWVRLLEVLRREGKLGGDRTAAAIAMAGLPSFSSPAREARAFHDALRAAPGVSMTAAANDIERILASLRAGEDS